MSSTIVQRQTIVDDNIDRRRQHRSYNKTTQATGDRKHKEIYKPHNCLIESMEESKGGTLFMKKKGSGTVGAGYHSKQGVYLRRERYYQQKR